MTGMDSTAVNKAIIALIRAAIGGKKLDALPEGVTINDICTLAFKATIIEIVKHGIIVCGLADEKMQAENASRRARLMYSEAKRHICTEKLFESFESAGVDFLPLKGYILKDLYPMPHMRPMKDVDILVSTAQFGEASRILEENGYVRGEVQGHHTEFRHPVGGMVELHNSLAGRSGASKRYFADALQKAHIADSHTHMREMTKEDFLIYVVFHMFKHYAMRGAGIRPILDIYLYVKKFGGEFDNDYLSRGLSQLGLKDFTDCVIRLGRVWFDGEAHDELTLRLEKIAFISGAYGTSEAMDAIAKSGESRGDGFASARSLVFPPLAYMKRHYSVLEKTPLLLPACWVARAFRAFFRPDISIEKRIRQNKDISKADAENLIVLKRELNLPDYFEDD